MEKVITPGIGDETFKIHLSDKFLPGDILTPYENLEYIILSESPNIHGTYIYNMTSIEDFYHKQFLIKYSQYLWF